MKHLYAILLGAALYSGVIYLFGSSRREQGAPPPAPSLAADDSEDPAARSQRVQERAELEASHVEERLREMQTRVEERSKLEDAERAMPASRQEARAAAAAGWIHVLSTNHDKYVSLLAQAKESAHGQVACTICDGLSYMPCVMCDQHDGKCIRCGGTGHLGLDAYCPACLKKGKCFLCAGSGKMLCPFCHDGMIDVKWPPPSPTPP